MRKRIKKANKYYVFSEGETVVAECHGGRKTKAVVVDTSDSALLTVRSAYGTVFKVGRMSATPA